MWKGALVAGVVAIITPLVIWAGTGSATAQAGVTLADPAFPSSPVPTPNIPGPISDTVIFVGCTSTLTPITEVGGGGTYTFAAPGVGCAPANINTFCSMFSDSEWYEIFSAASETGACNIGGSGTYSDIVCGTGTLGGGAVAGLMQAGTDTMSVNAEGSAPYASINYGVTLISGIGTLWGRVNSSAAPASDADLKALVGGVMDVIPVVGNCTTPVTQLLVTGNLSIQEPADGS